MGLLEQVLDGIRPLDSQRMKEARARVDRLIKPVGSLGKLEDIAVRLCGITGDLYPEFHKKTLVVMAADNGVYSEGVAPYPQGVTVMMVKGMVDGVAGASVFARLWGAELKVVDIGIRGKVAIEGVENRKVMEGTGNIAKGPAMTRAQAVKAIETGISAAFEAVDSGTDLIAVGEVGIGNTTTGSAVLAAMEGFTPREVTGRGSGVDDRGLERKIQVIERAIDINRPNPRDAVDVLSRVGGLDIAGMAGVFLGAAYRKTPVVIDGFISSVAALAAVRMAPLSLEYMFPSHLSAEKAGGLVMGRLGLSPYLDMNMRLGEGSGAVMAFGIIEAAARMIKEMKTFDEMGIEK